MILSSSSSTLVCLVAVLAVMAYIWSVISPPLAMRGWAWSGLLAWLAHTGILAHGIFLGRFGFGPALSVVAWMVFCIYSVESYFYPRMGVHRGLAILCACTLLLGLIFPGAAFGASSSVWLALHGALGVASYGLLALAAVHAALLHRADAQMRAVSASACMVDHNGLPLMTIERLMMAFTATAFGLLSCTLAAGWLFGHDLYGAGNVWLWNHKAVFSVLAWLMMAMLLAGRWLWGWRGKQAARFVYGSAALLLLSYVGSKFVLEVLLDRGRVG